MTKKNSFKKEISKKIDLKTKIYQDHMSTLEQTKLEIIRNKRNIKILIVVFVIMLFISTLMILSRPRINLKGQDNVTILMGQTYKEPGVIAKSLGKNINEKIKIESNVNLKKAGTYKIKYSVKHFNTEVKKIRNITIKDTIKPQVLLNGDQIMYMVIDTEYIEPGYTAIDNNDGDITKKVKVDNKINTKKSGSYQIDYVVTDASNNMATISRTVIVAKKTDPNIKTIYLTFDDGPSAVTPQVLDILKKHNIKATFFQIGKSDEYNDIIKRVYDEGHTLAIHSSTHKYGYIYSSADTYFKDLYELRDKLKSITGSSSNIIRFPGGSSNTVSNFNKGIMSKLVIDVIQKGFSYFDWNIDSGDTGRIGSDAIANNVISGLGSYHTYVVLMHDYAANQQTADALDRIIKYGKNNGYRFDKLTTDTPVVHHGVNN